MSTKLKRLEHGFELFKRMILNDKFDAETTERFKEAYFAGALSYDQHLFKSDGKAIKELHEESQAFAQAKIEEADRVINHENN